MKIHLCTVVGSDLQTFPHMLKHYRELGIDSFLITFHSEFENDPLLSSARGIVRSFGADIASVAVGPWDEDLNKSLYDKLRKTFPDDWFVLADSDELQVYPCPIADIVEFCRKEGFDFVEGCFLDRLAADGTLPTVGPGSIWEQFPLAGFVAQPVTTAFVKKVTLVRGATEVTTGQHRADSKLRCPPEKYYCQVNHFRWISSLVERLELRVRKFDSAEWKSLWPNYCHECKSFLEYYQTNSGRIDLSDERFLIAPATREYDSYQHWKTVMEWVMEHCY